MHSSGSRLTVFARKPAPIQMTYLGYCGATGLSTMDYRFSDPYLDSKETERNYREKTVYLPNSYWCYRPGGDAPEPSPPPVIEKGYVTFGCLNNFAKMSLPAQKLWAQILLRVKDSHLLVHSQPGKHQEEFKSRFAGWGIDADRLEFVAKQLWEQYMRTFARIDVALDPFPYEGGISTCDALWMGVPVVTLVGETSLGRAGKSILSNIGLPELVAKTPAEYVDIAVKLGGDVERLKELRSSLRRRMSESPLMKAKEFTSELETIFRQVWRRWCVGE
jgi:predicted O-linked N-acetylglucosamine transferase (SPINDLY family)